MYPRLSEAKKAVKAVGEEIRRVGLPRQLSPMIWVFTGSSGQVGQVPSLSLSLSLFARNLRLAAGSAGDLQAAAAGGDRAGPAGELREEQPHAAPLCLLGIPQ